ncbi:MAG TPA: PAS domain-containing protein [Vicinamibacterales bacterium]|nr:PAS domain-containing protein [Vicinamibacterales bacterium]
MDPPPSAADEGSRLAALRQYISAASPSDPALRELAQLAAAICQTPMAFIAFVDDARQWCAVAVGFTPHDTPRDRSIGAHAIGRTEPLIVADARGDARFAHDPLVSSAQARAFAAAPLLAPGGHVIGYLAVVDRVPRAMTDAQAHGLSALSRQVMTQLEVRRQTATLRESEEQLRLALDAAHMGTFDWDMKSGRIAWSRGHEELWGMAPGTFGGTYESFAERVHPDDLPAVNAEVERCLATRQTFEREFRVVWPDGTVRWVLGRGEFHFDAAGAAVRMRGVVQDTTARKAGEAAARENEERFNAAQRDAGIGSWRYLPDGTLVWSDQMYELLPVPRGVPLVYDRVLEVTHPDDRGVGNGTEFVRALQSGAHDYQADFRVVWPDGRVRVMHSRGTIHRDAVGRLIEAIGTTQDVTERRQTEARIRQLNRVYAMLGGISEALVREKDPATVLSAACRITVNTGGFRMAWIGLYDEAGQLQIRAHAGDDDGALAVIESLIREAPPGGCRFTADALVRGRHSICDNVATDPEATPWRDEALRRQYRSMASLPLMSNSRPIGVFNIYAAEADVFDEQEVRLLDDVATDISFALEVQRRDVERQQAEERFRLVVDNIREVFWIANVSGDLEFLSPAYETIWGRPRQPIYEGSENWLETVHPDDRARMDEWMHVQLLAGATDETYRIVRPDGTVRWIRTRSFPVRDPGGRVERMVGTSADVTEQRLLEEQFRQAQKMESVGRLAGGIAHDFNNLLTVINGTAELAALDLPRDSSQRTDLLQIRQAGERAAALTRQLLALSRQQILKPVILNLTTVVRGMQSMLRRLIGEHVELAFRFDDALGHVKADPSQIEQVILNLSVNAQDAMPDGGTLTVETGRVFLDAGDAAHHLAPRAGHYAMLAVSDTGIGMDEPTRQRIFEPFFTTKAIGKGTGLGLSTVYGIVQQSEGGLFVYSEPGHGTTFKVFLPLVEDEADVALALDAGDQSGTETILLVEDEPALRSLTRRVLSSVGYTVIDAGSGQEALAVLGAHEGPVHLMLTDVVMPGMNGRDLAVRVMATRPGIKVLYASGYTDDAIFRHGVLDDGSCFISKPYAPAELRRKVREALR